MNRTSIVMLALLLVGCSHRFERVTTPRVAARDAASAPTALSWGTVTAVPQSGTTPSHWLVRLRLANVPQDDALWNLQIVAKVRLQNCDIPSINPTGFATNADACIAFHPDLLYGPEIDGGYYHTGWAADHQAITHVTSGDYAELLVLPLGPGPVSIALLDYQQPGGGLMHWPDCLGEYQGGPPCGEWYGCTIAGNATLTLRADCAEFPQVSDSLRVVATR